MIRCPRCENMVDETVRTTCPLCYTPLPTEAPADAATEAPAVQAAQIPGLAPPQPTAPQPASSQPLSAQPPGAPPGAQPLGAQPLGAQPLGGQMGAAAPLPPLDGPAPLASNQRMTLSGDIIEAPPTVAPRPPAPGPAGGSGGPAGGHGGPAVHTMAGGLPPPTEYVEPPKSQLPQVLTLVVFLIFSFSVAYWFLHRTNPQGQADAFVKALKAKDYPTIYSLYDDDSAVKKKSKTAEDFEKDAKPQFEGPIGQMMATAEYKTKPPTTENGDTVVKVDVTLPAFNNMTVPLTLKMKNRQGIWKVEDLKGPSGAAMPGSGGGP